MGEIEVLNQLFIDKRIDLWWKDLIGQDLKSFSEFDFEKAEKTLPVSEIFASNMIKEKFKGVFSYVDPRKTWYMWNGIIHAPCDGASLLEKVIIEFYYSYKKALEILDEVIKREIENKKRSTDDESSGEELAEKLRKFMDKKFSKARRFEERLGTNAGVLAVSRRLQVDFAVGKEYYDNDQRWFVYKNGVIDVQELMRGKKDCVYPHDPSRNVTKYFDAEFTGENLGHWDAFLERSIPDEESRLFLQKVVGAGFMGISKTRMIVNLFGPPGSGKSTFMDAINKLGTSGSRYCIALDKNAITKTNDQVNFGQNDCRGRRFISISEPDHRSPIDDDFLKNYTGDENVTTRTLHAAFESWTPQGILFIASNAPLRINTRDLAIVDRLHMINFPNAYKEDPGVEEKKDAEKIESLLYQDRNRILQWILEGMEKYVKDSMKWHAPQKVIEHRGTIVASASVALRWLDDMVNEGYLEIDTYNNEYQKSISVNDAYSRFRMWKSFNGEKSSLSKSYFEEDISKKYFKAIRHNDKSIFAYIVKTDKYYKEYELDQSHNEVGNGKATFRF